MWNTSMVYNCQYVEVARRIVFRFVSLISAGEMFQNLGWEEKTWQKGVIWKCKRKVMCHSRSVISVRCPHCDTRREHAWTPNPSRAAGLEGRPKLHPHCFTGLVLRTMWQRCAAITDIVAVRRAKRNAWEGKTGSDRCNPPPSLPLTIISPLSTPLRGCNNLSPAAASRVRQFYLWSFSGRMGLWLFSSSKCV